MDQLPQIIFAFWFPRGLVKLSLGEGVLQVFGPGVGNGELLDPKEALKYRLAICIVEGTYCPFGDVTRVVL